MQRRGGKSVGRFSIDLEIANRDDLASARLGTIDQEKVRRTRVKGVVDSGAARLVLPQSVVKQLGLPSMGKVKVRYADGRTGRRETAEAHLELMGRQGTFTAIVEPKRKTALVGAIVLEDLDYLVDCLHERLVPRDPRFVVSEIE